MVFVYQVVPQGFIGAAANYSNCQRAEVGNRTFDLRGVVRNDVGGSFPWVVIDSPSFVEEVSVRLFSQ